MPNGVVIIAIINHKTANGAGKTQKFTKASTQNKPTNVERIVERQARKFNSGAVP